ncbi:MAG: cytochrome b/b6 domain-containing protein [Alphaproteobacteria bacterium]|nr:cytochrome b/b6 domain-containing protein [Alphaproteobacteria bacterium]
MTIHPLIVRITHWLNAIAVVIMILSGWQIYNASPIFPFSFPAWMTLGGWLGGAIQWHFAAMWLLMANGLIYLGYGVASSRIGKRFFPISPSEVFSDLSEALKGRLAHDDLAHYNGVQKVFYVGVIATLILVVLSGLAIWKPVQLWWLTAVFGGFQGARLVHFLAMAGIAAFILIHVVMALIVPKTIRAMVFGR